MPPSSSNIVAEYAKSKRSTCKGCNQSIPEKALRLGLTIRDPRGYDSTKWHHLECFSLQFDSPESIKGFDSLKSVDQEALKKLVEDADSKDKGKVKLRIGDGEDGEDEAEENGIKKQKLSITSPTAIGRSNRKRGQEKQPHTNGGRGGNRNIRPSTGAALYQEHLRCSMEASKAMVSLCTAEVQSSAQASHQPVDPDGDALKVLDKMVEEGLLRDGEQLYYFAVSSLQKSERFVQYFLKLSDNTKRVNWLQYEKAKDDHPRP